MEPAILLTTAYIMAMNTVLAVLIIVLLRLNGASRRMLLTTGAVLVAWMTGLLALVTTGSLFPQDLTEIQLFVVLILGVGVVTSVMFTAPVRRHLFSIPFEMLLVPQGLRVFFGAGFLIEGVLGVMPAAFGIADGITHIAAAVLALMTAIVYAKGYDYRFGAWFASIFGLVDIALVAGGISFFLLPEIGPHHNVMLAALFAAPIFIGLHVVAIARLVRTRHLGNRDLSNFPAAAPAPVLATA